jgi:hypothetical protein
MLGGFGAVVLARNAAERAFLERPILECRPR